MSEVELDEAALRDEAVRRSGLCDWGEDDSWRPGLSRLIEAFADVPQPVRARGKRIVGELLSKRLELEEDASRHPGILGEKIERPVFVIGLPRTGTTLLHGLLAEDPAARSPLEWEVAFPSPPPAAETFTTDPRIARVQARYDALLAAMPELRSMHPFGATLPAECNTISMLHFASPQFWATLDVPRYTEWLVTTRIPGVYGSHRRLLQQLQWKGPKGRWTLKSPAHLFDLEGLLAAYPDACLIQTHRDPARVMASAASLVWTLRTPLFGVTDRAAVGASNVRLWGAAIDRGLASRENPAVNAAVFDVTFAELNGDPIGALKRIYQRFRLPFTSEFEKRAQAYLERNARERQARRHSYSAEDFGLDAGRLEKRFAAYRERFELTSER